MNVLLPAFAMFALTMFVQFRLGALRFAAVRNGEIDPRFFKTYQGNAEPEKLRIHSRHLVNLYEAPVLFYAIVIMAFVTQQSGLLPVTLAWLYVALRIVHSCIHLSSNNVVLRFRGFLLSLVVLISLWSVVLAGILLR
jgi:hypothetical protein